MQKVISRLFPPRPRPLLLPAMALKKVTSKSGKGVYASSDTLFKGAVFGRDSIEVAEDILDIRPQLVYKILLTLAGLQGEVNSDVNEEEIGKIIHEYRTTTVDGKPLDDVSRHIFEELSTRWGGDDNSMAYYGSIDSTPHFIRLLGRYVAKKGPDILDERIILRSGHKLSMALVLENSVDWLINHLNNSRSGLVEYLRRNPLGIENQVWKDSGEFYVHENKQMANHSQPIASIEVQGLAYDALLAASRMMPERAEELRLHARSLRQGTIWLLWQPERNYFALGTDYGPDGKLRVIDTPTANPAALLDTEFFDDLPEKHRQEYVGSLVRAVMGRDFLTDAGVRSRGLSRADLIPFWDYHGSFTSWPKETYDIAKGLKRQGFPQLAKELENRLLNIVLKNWEYPEYVYVDEWGRVLSVSPSAHEHGDLTMVDSTNSPERIQAWTVSAIFAIVTERFASKVKKTNALPEQQPWQIELEKRMLANIPRVKRLLNPIALRARYPTYGYKLIKAKSKASSNFLHDKIKKK